jgi:hypothetical protein
LIVCVVIGAVVIDRTASKSYACADVGLVGPAASSPERALAAFVESRGGDAADWKRTDHRTNTHGGVAPSESYDFAVQRTGARPNLKLITVQGSGRMWSAQGACVS